MNRRLHWWWWGDSAPKGFFLLKMIYKGCFFVLNV